jgi:hypothetical protein
MANPIINMRNLLVVWNPTTERLEVVTNAGLPTSPATPANATASTVTTEDWVYVTASDISSFPLLYVAGSAGMIKRVTAYVTGAINGDQTVVTTYQYADSANPTQFTKISQAIGVKA